MGMIFSKILHDGMIRELHGFGTNSWDGYEESFANNARHGIWSRNMYQKHASPAPKEGTQAFDDELLNQNFPTRIKEDKMDEQAQAIFSEFLEIDKEHASNPQGESSSPIMKLMAHPIKGKRDSSLTGKINLTNKSKVRNSNGGNIFDVKDKDVNADVKDKKTRHKSILSASPSTGNPQKRNRVTISDSDCFNRPAEIEKQTVAENGFSMEQKPCLIEKATTNLVGRLGKSIDGDLIDIEYHFSRHSNKDEFKASGSMGNLIRDVGGIPHYGNTEKGTHEAQMTNFFQNIELLLNNCYGVLHWNGATIVVKDDPKDRLQVAEYELEPTKLYFIVKGLKELQIIRSPKRLELNGQDAEGCTKWFRMRGPVVPSIGIEHAGNGRICLLFPDT